MKASAAAAAAAIRLSWPGKTMPVPPAPPALALVESYEAHRPLLLPETSALLPATSFNHLLQGDNYALLQRLLTDGWAGTQRLIYADPPYNSGVKWARKVRLRQSGRGSAATIIEQQIQYDDAWDDAAYLQFLYQRLPLLRELLAGDGSLWLHCDHRHAHHVRALLEEIFGAENYLNTITWRSQPARGAKVNAFYFPYSAQTIHIFARNRRAPTRWHPQRRKLIVTEREAAQQFMRDDRGFFRTSDPGTYSFAKLCELHGVGRIYAPFGGKIEIDEANQRLVATRGGAIGVKYYLTPAGNGLWAAERGVDNVWEDIPGLGVTPAEDLGYPTQKTRALLNRIIATATDPGDWVLDPFCGSGVTPATAQQMGRRWLAMDSSNHAIQTTRRRLHGSAVKGDPPFARHVIAGAESSATTAVRPSPPLVTASIHRNSFFADTIELCIDDVTLTGLPDDNRFAAAGWHALVDAIAIDPAYDGRCFRASVVDAPLRKGRQVAGRYALPSGAPAATIALYVTDVRGGETMVLLAP